MKRDPFVIVGLAVGLFLVTLLAINSPESALAPVGLAGGVIALLWLQSDRRTRKARPCRQCGRRFRGADMVEHHVNEHRECAS